jgi:hypothetical protein
MTHTDRVLAEVDRATDEIVEFTADLVRIPTINPPGDEYEACARFLGDHLRGHDFDVEYFVADGLPEHTARYPRVNVVGTRRGGGGPVVHLNGHIDVVPPGDGWTLDPFGGLVRDGRIFGRGVCDMKAGLAAAVYAWIFLFPGGDGANPVCELGFRPEPPEGDLVDLAAAIPYRMTSRIRGERAPLASGDQEALASLAAACGAKILWITDPGKLAEAGALLGKLNRIGYFNPESHPGIMKMLRWTEQEVEETRDGIPVNTMELSPVELTGLHLMNSYQVLKYMKNLGAGRALESMPVAWAKSASALCLLVLPRAPSAGAFFEAGRVLERLWLTATVRGLAFQLLGVSSYFDRMLHGGGEGFSAAEQQILDQARSRYAALFEIPVGVCETVLFRIARPNAAVGRAPRRRIEDLMADVAEYKHAS